MPPTSPQASSHPRILSIDGLRGLIMFLMIFVNDLNEDVAPDWMRHYSDVHTSPNASGMTFVDLVFPAFLFIVGLSIPIALGRRLAKNEPLWRILLHILTRAASLIAIGILMVNSESGPNTKAMGWSANLWRLLLYIGALLAFCSIGPTKPSTPRAKTWHYLNLALHLVGLSLMLFLALAYRGKHDARLLTLSPLTLRTHWYGILGLIGWAYLVASLVFLVFRNNRTALLGSMVLLLTLFAADHKGAFNHFWLEKYVHIGEALGALAAISVAGILLGSILQTPDTTAHWPRIKFTLWLAAGASAGALLLHRLYGISKNNATPSWCLWAIAITSIAWLLMYLLADVAKWSYLSKPLALAGQNVLLAYLLSELRDPLATLTKWDEWYDHLATPHLANAITRSATLGVIILILTALLTRLNFRVKL